MSHFELIIIVETMYEDIMSYFVHMCSFDTLSTILKEEKIDRQVFVSFTNGMPFFMGHGDTAIVFKKQNLLDEGYEFKQVEYTKEFIERHLEIKQHILEYQTEDEFLIQMLKPIEFEIQKIEALISDPIIKKLKLEEYNEIKKLIKNDPLGYILQSIQYENEMLIHSPFEFDVEDVEAIIHSSRIFNGFYPIPKIYFDKTFFIEDYYPPSCMFQSPLYYYMANIEGEIQKYQELGASFAALDISRVYQFVYSLILNPGWQIFAKRNIKSPIELPSSWNEILKEIHTIDDINLKVQATDYVYRSYILQNNLHISMPESEKFILGKLFDYQTD